VLIKVRAAPATTTISGPAVACLVCPSSFPTSPQRRGWEVVEVGSEVTHVKPGDEVVVHCGVSCRMCDACANARTSSARSSRSGASRLAPSTAPRRVRLCPRLQRGSQAQEPHLGGGRFVAVGAGHGLADAGHAGSYPAATSSLSGRRRRIGHGRNPDLQGLRREIHRGGSHG